MKGIEHKSKVTTKESGEHYSREWFRNRAFSSLTQMAPGMWDYSDSLLLYAPGNETAYESVQEAENRYHALVTAPERQYLELIANSIVSALPEQFEYIDLGPGTEHKEQFIFDEVKRQKKEFVYRPVDINQSFLKLAAEYAGAQGIPIKPVQAAFEELTKKLGRSTLPRFVSLGLTYSNYEPRHILALLQSMMGKSGTAFINSQIRERVDMNEVESIYTEVAARMSKSKLELLGLNPDTDVEPLRADDGIRAWYTLRNTTPELEKKGLVAGDNLLVLESLRPTRSSLEVDIASVFERYTILDKSGPFVGALLQSTDHK